MNPSRLLLVFITLVALSTFGLTSHSSAGSEVGQTLLLKERALGC